jgi:hypothetical protein
VHNTAVCALLSVRCNLVSTHDDHVQMNTHLMPLCCYVQSKCCFADAIAMHDETLSAGTLTPKFCKVFVMGDCFDRGHITVEPVIIHHLQCIPHISSDREHSLIRQASQQPAAHNHQEGMHSHMHTIINSVSHLRPRTRALQHVTLHTIVGVQRPVLHEMEATHRLEPSGNRAASKHAPHDIQLNIMYMSGELQIGTIHAHKDHHIQSVGSRCTLSKHKRKHASR